MTLSIVLILGLGFIGLFVPTTAQTMPLEHQRVFLMGKVFTAKK